MQHETYSLFEMLIETVEETVTGIHKRLDALETENCVLQDTVKSLEAAAPKAKPVGRKAA